MKYKSLTVHSVLVFCTFLVSAIAGYVLWQNHMQLLTSEVDSYARFIYKVEREVIENIPIYDDYKSPAFEKKFRTFLFPYHMKIVQKNKFPLISDDSVLETYIKDGVLLPLDTNTLYYFYGVPKKYRYARKKTVHGLALVTGRFQKHVTKKNINFQVKLAVSSVIRPAEYQKTLRQHNGNAVVESTHSYGVSFDIFFDDFYVVLPEITDQDKAKHIKEILRRKYGFLLGDSLRRQFKTILAKTLLELQDEGVLYAILERNQRCFHVTVR